MLIKGIVYKKKRDNESSWEDVVRKKGDSLIEGRNVNALLRVL